MKNYESNYCAILKPLVFGGVLFSVVGVTQAVTLTEAQRLLEAAGDPNGSKFMKDWGLTVGGWLNAGITYNSNSPANNFNGPVTFGDRSGEFQLNQLNMFLQRAVATEGDAFDLGFRFDVMFGTDSIWTQAYGVPSFDVNTGMPLSRGNWDLNLINGNGNRFYDIALPQAYLESYIPVGNGLNVKAGHFYTPIGYETVPAPDNFFYSHAYTMQWGEPFTHTGILGNYTIDKNWAVMGGVVTGSATGGWDGNFNKQLGNWDGIGGVTWTSDDTDTSLNISGTYGGTSEQGSQTWGIYSVVLKHNINEKAHMVLQHDHGYANGVFGGTTDAEWYGINSHWYYDISDTLVAGLRAEWFRDQNGFRVCSPGRVAAATDPSGNSYASPNNPSVACNAASYYELTAGVTWKPYKWLSLRPNVRYDWADGHTANGARARPYGDIQNVNGINNGNKLDQLLFSTDITLNF